MSTPEKSTPPQTASETKLEISENATPEQIVIQLETETKVSEIKEPESSPAEDLREFAHRVETRIKLLNEIFEKTQENPGLRMAQQLIDWGPGGAKSYLDNLPKKTIEYIEKPEHADAEKLMAHLIEWKGYWSYIESVYCAASRLEAYIQPLLKKADYGALPIRALVAVFKATAIDLNKVLRRHDITIDDVRILSVAPKDAEVNYHNPEGFLFFGLGKTLPLKEMQQLIINEQKTKPKEIIVTDIKELGGSFRGQHIRKTVVIPYQENTWHTAMSGYDIPEFKTK